MESHWIFDLIENGEYEKIKDALEEDPTLINLRDDIGRDPLIIASTENNTQLVEYFLSLGADPLSRDKNNDQAIHWAFVKSNFKMAKMLLEKGADIHSLGSSNNCVSALISCGKDVPLLIDLILENGIDITFKSLDFEMSLLEQILTNNVNYPIERLVHYLSFYPDDTREKLLRIVKPYRLKELFH